MAFGDVNLQDTQIQSEYAGSPGDGGWPTIRVYNKKTGYGGAFAGDWKEANKLEGAMCDVFGKDETMQAYVEEMADVLLCTELSCLCGKKEDGECSKQELSYHAKFASESLELIQSRMKLLSASLAKSGKADKWMSERIAILKLLASTRQAADKAAAKEEL